MSQIIIRPFKPEDTGLIYSSYAKGVYYGKEHHEDIEQNDQTKDGWFKDFHTKVNQQIQDATIYVACSRDDEDFTLGYAIIQNNVLQFVYVKPLYRNQGIATLLTKDKYQTINPNHMTKVGYAIITRRNNEIK